MKKKSIIFLADSTVDLMGLYQILSSSFNIIWVVYHRGVYDALKESNIENVHLSNLSIKILNGKNFFIKILRYFLSLFKIKFNNYSLHKKLKRIEIDHSPVLIITDTISVLSEYKTKIVKLSTKHAIPYNKNYLHEDNLKYDYIYFPGNYHLDRFKEFYNFEKKEKLVAVGNTKISYFLKNKNFDKNKYLLKLGLETNKTNVVFAPWWKAHGKDILGKWRYLPKNFGNQVRALYNLAREIKKINCNLIIKLHHYSHSFIKKKDFKKLGNETNCYIFNSGEQHDIVESNEVFMLSDIIVTDLSGVASTGIFLDKKIIFLNPEQNFDWTVADIEKKYRPGFVCNSLEETIDSVKKYIKNSDPFIEDRKKFVDKMFYKPHEDANKNIAKHIEDITK